MTNVLLRLPSMSYKEEGLKLERLGVGNDNIEKGFLATYHSHFIRTAFKFKPSKVLLSRVALISTMTEQGLMLALCIGIALILFNRFLHQRSK